MSPAAAVKAKRLAPSGAGIVAPMALSTQEVADVSASDARDGRGGGAAVGLAEEGERAIVASEAPGAERGEPNERLTQVAADGLLAQDQHKPKRD